MKVKELVRDTIWMPGSQYVEHVKPKVSVILPTYRRGKSGMFRRAVQAVLDQSLTDLELIIVDDASTDGTSDQIAEFMRRDGRVSCLRHQKNIGLPAISEYEAYMRARSDMIAFAFDDDYFYPNALEDLLEQSEEYEGAVCYGYVEWTIRDPSTGESTTGRLGGGKSQGALRGGNFVPNNGVLLPRHVIEDVGFYDPHVIMARVCDWDLWRRVADRYELRFVDVAVALVEGPSTTDSLGSTYRLDSWAAEEWMRTARNEQLRPSAFPEYEILVANPAHGESTRTVCETVGYRHALQRGWIEETVEGRSGEGYALVVNTDYDASTTLCFDMLPQKYAQRVRVISTSGVFGIEEMARATCVIFIRRLRAFQTWIDAAKAMDIPVYYYLDDNFPLLTERNDIKIPGEDFSSRALRSSLRSFAGVFLTSQELVKYFSDRLIHENLLYFPPACVNQSTLVGSQKHDPRDDEIVVAFAGGSHRHKGLWDAVVPALQKVAREGMPIHFVTTETDGDVVEDTVGHENFRVTLLPFDPGYAFAIRRYGRYGPHFVVHAPSDTENNRYKTRNVLLTANLLSAVAVLPDTEPYRDIADDQIAFIVKDPFLTSRWYEAFKTLFSGKIDNEALKVGNAVYCKTHFSGVQNGQVLDAIFERHGGEPDWMEQQRRLHALAVRQRMTAGQFGSGTIAALGSLGDASQLARFRKMQRYSWRHRLLRGSTDLWNSCAPEFLPLCKASEAAGWRKPFSSLELSDTLHELPFREYKVDLPAGKLRGVSFALAVDWLKQGIVGVEVVAPNDAIVAQVGHDLATLDLSRPVEFSFNDIPVTADRPWRFRVFCRSHSPVYVYEFINRRLLGLRFSAATPFAEFVIA
ncbi:glycosyltransferase [Cupriavidus sp. WGlv3]|uniref:glycosyltransferase n=1 Tax=Cupriavidus sp. WGlv3 TaxID=2919924 RepID=UPI0020906E68|nr:glycosyltransferase [Cupriavidus sp. WGlv3]MCO4861557.1 glycosyltransferase [Cupriavidus sp. WGlv3]